MPKIILNSLALVSWSEHEYYLMSFFWCLSIWQCQNVFSFWQNLTLDIKELITPSSGQEWFMHWCLSMDFSLPDKSAVHREKKKSVACTCHITWCYAQTTPEIHSIFPVSHTMCHAGCNFGTLFLQYFNGQTWVIHFPISNPSALTVQNSWGYELMQRIPAVLSILSSGLSVSSPRALEK